MIDPSKLGFGREDYYLRQVAEDREAYLTGHGEAPGYILGTAAPEALGLSGEVTAEQFKRLFVGEHPDTGKLLGRRHRKDGVLAYDFVFRPTKSVSLLYGLGDREEAAAALAAHHAGLRAAVEYLERFAVVRRGRNGVEKVGASGLLAVGFDHRTSRPGDPLLHTHVIVINRAQGSDERWTALDGRPILSELRNADAVYRNTYQRELTRTLGLAWAEPDEHGNCELVGVPESELRAFSKARGRIEEECEQREAEGLPTGPAVRHWLAHKLREDKCHEPLATLRDRWAAEAAGRGWDVRGTFDRMRGQARTCEELGPDEIATVFEVLAGPHGLTANTSTFTRGEVLRAVANQPQATTLPMDQIERLADRFVEERSVQVCTDVRTGALRYSTPELLELERSMVEAALARQDEGGHVVSGQVLRAVIVRFEELGKPLGADQAEVLRAVCTDGAGVSPVVGRAGTGKTFTMDAVRLCYETANLALPERKRVRVRGLAPTGIAALELASGAGVDARTVDRFLTDLDNGRDALTGNDLVIVDEGNMLGTRKFARLFDHANQVGAKLITVGDHKQLQSIEAGGWFRSLRLRLGAVELVENRRQLDPLDRQAVELIRQGLSEEALQLYRDGGRVTVARTAVEAHDAMARDWWQAFSQGEDAVMLSHRRVEVDRLNDLAHAAMAAAGRLTGDALENQGREFRVGDRVVCGANRLKLGVANGTCATVSVVDVETRTLTISLDGDQEREVMLPADYLAKQLGKGRRPIDHAYAITGHKSEGVTVDRVFVRGGGHADQEWGYTVMTRVRQRADLYLVEGPTPSEAAEELDLAPPRSQDPYDVVVAALCRSNPQRLAIDAEREAERPHPSTLPIKELRAERDRLDALLASAPRSQQRAHHRVAEQLADAEARLAAARNLAGERDAWLACHGRGPAGLARRDAVKHASAEAAHLAEQQRFLEDKVVQLAERERGLRRHEQHRAVWAEAHATDLAYDYQVRTELAWRSRARSRARTVETPGWLTGLLGKVPEGARGRRAWRAAAEQLEGYRDHYRIDAEGLDDRPTELAQLREWRTCQQMIDRLAEPARGRDQQREPGRGQMLEIG